MAADHALHVDELVRTANHARFHLTALRTLGRGFGIGPGAATARLLALRPDVATLAALVPLERGAHAAEGLDVAGSATRTHDHLSYRVGDSTRTAERKLSANGASGSSREFIGLFLPQAVPRGHRSGSTVRMIGHGGWRGQLIGRTCRRVATAVGVHTKTR